MARSTRYLAALIALAGISGGCGAASSSDRAPAKPATLSGWERSYGPKVEASLSEPLRAVNDDARQLNRYDLVVSSFAGDCRLLTSRSQSLLEDLSGKRATIPAVPNPTIETQLVTAVTLIQQSGTICTAALRTETPHSLLGSLSLAASALGKVFVRLDLSS